MNDSLNPEELKDVRELLGTMKKFLKDTYPDGDMKRNFHPKLHGFLEATFTVRSDIPKNLQYGLFQKPGTYAAWVRFSNAPPKVQSDKRSSGRGLAIKVMNVEGPVLEKEPDGEKTQNFLLTTSPILSAWNIRLYKKAMYAVLFGFFEQLKFALHPGHWRSIFLTLKYSKKHENLLSQTYFSGAAFKLGPEQFGKFVLNPQDAGLGYTLGEPKHDDFLKAQLKKDLETIGHGFTLGVQLHQNEKEQPLENTSIAWKAPVLPLADLWIPAQSFDHPERIALGEAMAFSPWIALKDHEPVGGINRARRLVYKELAAFRKK